MLKKILYIAASFLVGFMLLSSIVVTNFYSVFQDFVAEDVKNEEYSSAERFFSRVVDENKFYSALHDGAYIEVYSALNDSIKFVYEEKEGKLEKTETTYYTLESSIQFSLFNLSDDFALVDDTTNSEDVKKGGVKLLLGDNETLFFPFVTETIDYYSFASSYSYLPLSISYSEYVEALGDKTNVTITGASIIDGNGVEQFTISFDNNPTFDTKFHNDFYEILERYNKLQEENAKGNEINDDEANKIVTDYEAVLSANPTYLEQHDFNLIYGSFDFLFAVILSAVIFLALDILLGWFIFRKKKPAKYIPPSQTKTQTTRQPEQFSRDVFNLEEDDVVETPVVETPVEETTEETVTEESTDSE